MAVNLHSKPTILSCVYVCWAHSQLAEASAHQHKKSTCQRDNSRTRLGNWKCRTGKWQTKVQGWKIQDEKITIISLTGWIMHMIIISAYSAVTDIKFNLATLGLHISTVMFSATWTWFYVTTLMVLFVICFGLVTMIYCKTINVIINVMGCWHGYFSWAGCRFAYGPADATATHFSCSRFYLSGTSSPG